MAQQAAPYPPTPYSGPIRKRPFADRILGRDWKIAFPFIAPIIVLMVIFIAWPFLDALYTSMTIRTLARETRFVWFDNYVRLYTDIFYLQSVRATFVFTGFSILFKLIFGLIAALLLSGLTRGRNLITGLVLLPWIIPSVVQALAFRSIYDPLFGGLNPLLQNLGLINQNIGWLTDHAMASVIVVNVWAGIPFFTVNMLAGIQSIDKEMYEAAEIDGANAWDKLMQITLPSLRYVIAVATLLSTIWTFNNFELIFLLTGGGPGGATKVYSILAYEKAIRALQFGPGTAVAFSLTPVLAFFILLLSRFMRRDAAVDDEVAWQDHVINAFGWVLGGIGRIISFPILLVIQALSTVLPSGSKSRKRNHL